MVHANITKVTPNSCSAWFMRLLMKYSWTHDTGDGVDEDVPPTAREITLQLTLALTAAATRDDRFPLFLGDGLLAVALATEVMHAICCGLKVNRSRTAIQLTLLHWSGKWMDHPSSSDEVSQTDDVGEVSRALRRMEGRTSFADEARGKASSRSLPESWGGNHVHCLVRTLSLRLGVDQLSIRLELRASSKHKRRMHTTLRTYSTCRALFIPTPPSPV